MATLGLELTAAFEKEVAEDKARNFRGTALIRFVHLVFSDPVRFPNPKDVKRLEREFEGSGCLQYSLEYSIPAIIEERTLEYELERLGITAEEFKNKTHRQPPKLQLPIRTKLEGLNGQHRVLAGAAFIRLSEQWWTVDLYGQGLAEKTKQRLREGDYASNFTDGEIFRQVRLSRFQKDRIRETRWMARLSPPKARNLRALMKRDHLINALDSILAFRGLWVSFKLGSMDVFSTLRCDEEIAYYITHIGFTWSLIIGDISLVEFIDEDTISNIQLRAPAVSKDDEEFISTNMQSGMLFPQIKDPLARAGIMQRLLAVDYLIPSLNTLFRDIRYIEPAAEFLKALVPGQSGTLREQLLSHFWCRDLHEAAIQIQIRQGHQSYITVTGDRQDMFELAFRELWLCSLRSIATPSNAPKRDMNPEIRTAKAPNYLLWFKMVELANRLGFSSPAITCVLKKDPIEKMVAEGLCELIPQQIGKLSDVQIQALTKDIKVYLSQLEGGIEEDSIPWATVHGSGVPRLQRCGISPNEHLDTSDHNHLFLNKVHAPISDYRNGGGGLSTFFVKRCRYLAFLGPASISEVVKSGITIVS